MDRRQRKSREAILGAFTALLSEKRIEHITVRDIIDRADVGRATFYAHFETKDYLLKELCEDLFCHIFDAVEHNASQHKHMFQCDAPDSVFLHLFEHLQKNDHHILDLLSCENNDLFLQYFKSGLIRLIEQQPMLWEAYTEKGLPRTFWIHHIAVSFVETVRWWIDQRLEQSPAQITQYFLNALSVPNERSPQGATV